jgi:hypothetical protein
MATNLKKTIMRRVYYSYAVSFVSESMLWQGFVLGACIALFGRLTHVAAIAHNFGATKLENAPSFVWNSVAHALEGGEVMTVLVAFFMTHSQFPISGNPNVWLGLSCENVPSRVNGLRIFRV